MQDINSVLFPVSAGDKHPHTKEVIKIAESMGITQTEIAKLIGCSQPNVNHLKQGKGLANTSDLEPLIFRLSPKLPGEEFYQYTVFKHKTYALPENWEKRVIVHAYSRHDKTDRYRSRFDNYDQEFNKIREKHLSYLEKSKDHIKEEIDDINRLINGLSSILEKHIEENNESYIKTYKSLITHHLNTWILPFLEEESIDDMLSKILPNLDTHIEDTLENLFGYKEKLCIKIIDIEKTNKEKIKGSPLSGFFDKEVLKKFITEEFKDPDHNIDLEILSEELFSNRKFEIKNDYQNISFDMASEFVEWAKSKNNISTEITTEIIQLCGKSLWLYESEHRREINEWDDGDDPDREYGLDRFGNDEVYIKTDIYLRILESNSSRLYIIERDSGISYYTTINGPYTSLEILDVIRNRYSDKFNLNIDEIESKLVKEGYPLPGIRYIY